MGARITLSILLSLGTLAGCASTRPAEEEPADPTGALSTPAEEEAPAAEAPAGIPVEAEAPAVSSAGTGPEATACPAGQAPLSVKLLVLLRHPTDPIPALPADGFSLAVDGKAAASGLRVGQVTRSAWPPASTSWRCVGASSRARSARPRRVPRTCRSPVVAPGRRRRCRRTRTRRSRRRAGCSRERPEARSNARPRRAKRVRTSARPRRSGAGST
jgi:hypothetical protein